jgi:hypothetical protein
MSKTYHVYSKMAADVTYNDYVPGGDIPRVARSVTIKGGAGVANKNIITPYGVHTEITEEERDMLLKNGIFQLHQEAGFVTIEGKKEDPDRVATNLTAGPDPSAPLTPEDFAGANPEQVAVPEQIKRSRGK